MAATPPLTQPVPLPPRKSRTRRNKIWNLTLAIFFYLLGFIGVFIPIMPQILFFVMGTFFLSLVSPTVRRWVRRFLHRHPRLADVYKRWRDKGRQKRLALIRRRKALAQRLHLHRHGVPHPTSTAVDGGER